MSKYYEMAIARGYWDHRNTVGVNLAEEPSMYSCYADPLTEVLLLNVTDKVAKIVGKNIAPTYSFSRVYVKGDELTRHIDRVACEYSATINVAYTGEQWPIYLEAPNHDPKKICLNPGDAVIYKGCEVYHWRPSMVETKSDINVQCMLHFVDLDGPHADHVKDKRIAYGASDDTR